MSIQDWWPLLDASTQQWLINNNGDIVPPRILEQMTAAAGHSTAAASWVGDDGPDGFFLSDEAVDWIEQTANNEESKRE